ncbi:MAG: MFS transporter [Acidimicrobiales bacterium]
MHEGEGVTVGAPSPSPSPAALGRAAAAIVALTTVVSHAFGRSTYGLLLPAMEDSLGLTHAQAGLGGTVIYGAYLAGVVAVSILATRCEPIVIMRVGVGVGAVGLALVAAAQDLATLLPALALAGGAGAGIWITAPAIATAGVPPHRRGLVIGALSATIGGATFLVGMGARALRAELGDGVWRPIWVVEAAVAAALLAGLVLVVRPAGTVRAGGGFSLARLRAVPSWGRITGAYALFGAAGAGFAPFVVEALEQDAGFTRAQASTIWAFMGVVAIPGAPLLGFFSDRLGRKPMMGGVLAAAGVGVSVVGRASGPAAVAAVLLFGAVWSSFPTLTAAYVRDHADARSFAAAFATMTIFYSLAALAAPYTVGWLADHGGGFATPFLLLGALCAAGAGLIASLPAGAGRSS